MYVTPLQPFTPQLVAGEIGKIIKVDPQVLAPGNITTLTGSTVEMVVISPKKGRFVFAMVVDGTGAFATYTTAASGTDFITPGEWQVQFVATFDSTHIYTSPATQLEVLPRL